jgi:hypothetical protein
VLLEILRALQAGPALENDVLFLITDGEELGLLGARAFVEEHPWAEDIGVVLNFEARGTSGPAFMFQTSRGNGWLVREFARAAPYPIGSSLSAAVYELLPNDTDLTVFMEAGHLGLNFAYIENLPHYHTWLDDVDHLDRRSLQQQGANALALTRHFGEADLEDRDGTHQIYFNPLGFFLIHYPGAWAMPLAAAAMMLAAAILWMGSRKGLLNPLGIFVSFLVFLLGLGCVTAIGWLLWRLILHYQDRYAALYGGDYYFACFIAVAVSVFAVIYGRVNRTGACNLWCGALLGWLFLALLTAAFLPGGSYLFAWPLIFGLMGLAAMIAANEEFSPEPKAPAWMVLFVIPGLLIIAPTIDTLHVAMTLAMAPGLMLMTGLLLGLLIPQLVLMSRRGRWWLPALSIVAAAAFAVAGFLTSGYDADHRKPNSIFYLFDADEKQSFWGSLDDGLDEWTSQFFSTPPETASLGEIIPARSGRFLKSPAVSAELAAPRLQVLENRTEADRRKLSVRISSPRGATNCMVFLDSTVEVVQAAVDGKPIRLEQKHGSSESGWGLLYSGLPREGFILSLEVNSNLPLEIELVDQSYDLPDLPNLFVRSRPSYMMPALGMADSTLVRSSRVIP